MFHLELSLSSLLSIKGLVWFVWRGLVTQQFQSSVSVLGLISLLASIPRAAVVAVEDDDIAASGLREKPTRTLLTQASLFDVVAQGQVRQRPRTPKALHSTSQKMSA